MAKCSSLGLKEDPKTALDFASYGNFCHHAYPAEPPKPAHQKTFCLTENYKSCPVFLLKERRPLPAHVTARESQTNFRENFSYRILGGVFLLLALVLVAALVIWGNSSSAVAIPEGTLLVRPTDSIVNANGGSLPIDGPTATLNLTRAACPPPNGSVRYMVQPNDSIFQLSLIFEVKVVDLLSANCLKEEDLLQAGETIYIPPKKTYTPTKPPYVSPTATVGITPLFTATQTRDIQSKPPTPRPQPTNTPVPVEPTAIPVQPTPTSPPPPTSPPEPTSPPPPTSPSEPTSPPPPVP